MKLEPVTNPDRRNKKGSKNVGDGVLSINCEVIVFFSIYGQFGAIRKPDSGLIVRFHNLHFH